MCKKIWVILLALSAMRIGQIEAKEIIEEKKTKIEAIPFVKEKEITEAIVEQEKKENLLCDLNKYLTYTNINEISINWNYIALDNFYIDADGFVRETNTNAYAVAMGTKYEKGNYYNITLNNNMEFLVKVVDIKSDNHTTQNCYTTHDNGIVEIWITNQNYNFRFIGNSKVKNISVVKIEEVDI